MLSVECVECGWLRVECEADLVECVDCEVLSVECGVLSV